MIRIRVGAVLPIKAPESETSWVVFILLMRIEQYKSINWIRIMNLKLIICLKT